MKQIRSTRTIFDRLKKELLDVLILYNEMECISLARDLGASEIGYVVQIISFTAISLLCSVNDKPEPSFSKLEMPDGYILKIISDFHMELFPNTSLMVALTLHINFLEEAWEVTGSTGNSHRYGYCDNVSLEELKGIVDQNISSVRRYIIQ